MENKKAFPIIVNLFGAPGAGKSTAAAYIFSKLKMLGINAELVTEYAKDKLWEENPAPFKNQLYILAKQYFRITRCAEKVDVIITDSPILLNILYNKNKSILDENFDRLVCNIHNSYNNFNVYINRTVTYEPVGRFQNEEESNIVGEQTIRLLEEKQVPHITITNDISEYDEIVNKISLLCNYLRIVDCACVKDCHNCVVKNICQSDAVPEKIKEYREKLVMCDDGERDELSSVKINSCPFCNLAPTIRKGKNDTYYVVCDKCREETREYKERVDAIKAWNSQTFSEIEAVDIYCDNLFSEMTEQKNNEDLEIKGATLLSIEEAEKLSIDILKYEGWWWLRSPGYFQNIVDAVNCDGSIYCFGYPVRIDHGYVRPALLIQNLESSNFEIGDTFTFREKQFKIISEGLAFCLEDIGRSCFSGNGSDYETSEIKKYVDDWFNGIRY